MKLSLVVGVKKTDSTPVTEPVTLAEAKEWCKVELNITEENTLITELIKSAREMCEAYTCISFVPKTIIAILNNTGGGTELPYGPVKTDTTPDFKDKDGNTIAASGYVLRGDLFKYLESPCDDSIKATYDTEWQVFPTEFKTALKQQIVWLYENRGDSTTAGQLSPMAKQTLKPHRRIW